jgi:hypothetical protein
MRGFKLAWQMLKVVELRVKEIYAQRMVRYMTGVLRQWMYAVKMCNDEEIGMYCKARHFRLMIREYNRVTLEQWEYAKNMRKVVL